MEGLTEFLRMGGYAAYVWPAYAATAAVLVALLVGTLRSLRAQERTATMLERDLPPRRRRRAGPRPAPPDSGNRR